MATKTINLTGAEVAVIGLDGAHAHIRNDGTEVIYAAKTAGITAGADGVASIPAGQSDTIRGISGAVYLLGTGSVLIQSDDYVASPFKTSATSGGSGADEVARAAINAHSGNAEIHVTANEKEAWNAVNYSNPNLLINPDFRINQRGKSGYSSIGYGYDHWYVGRNTGSVNAANGKCMITCTDTSDTQHIIQFIEGDYSGKTLTFSLNVEAIEGCTMSIRVADDNYATIDHGTISSVAGKVSCRADVPASFNGIIRVLISFHEVNAVGSYFTFSEPKLEIGTIATPFVPPDPATELAKCQRYYYRFIHSSPMLSTDNCTIGEAFALNSNNIIAIIPVPAMRHGVYSSVDYKNVQLVKGVDEKIMYDGDIVALEQTDSTIQLVFATTNQTAGDRYRVRLIGSDAYIALNKEI